MTLLCVLTVMFPVYLALGLIWGNENKYRPAPRPVSRCAQPRLDPKYWTRT